MKLNKHNLAASVAISISNYIVNHLSENQEPRDNKTELQIIWEACHLWIDDSVVNNECSKGLQSCLDWNSVLWTLRAWDLELFISQVIQSSSPTLDKAQHVW